MFELLCTLGAVNMPAAPSRGIKVSFNFAVDPEVVGGLTRVRTSHLLQMMDFDRGDGKVCGFGDVIGTLQSVTLPTKTDRPGTFVVEFPENASTMALVSHIRSCDPPTALLVQTQMELGDEEPEASEPDDGQESFA